MSVTKSVNEYFDEIYNYGSYYEGPWALYRRKYVSYITKELSKKNDIKILDLGCGPMCSLPDLLVVNNISLYKCVDSSNESIATLKKRLHKYSHVSVQQDEVVNFVDQCSEKFDVIILFGVVMYINREKVKYLFSRLGNILSDQGLIVLHEPNENAEGMLDRYSQVFTHSMIYECHQILSGTFELKVKNYNIVVLRTFVRRLVNVNRRILTFIKFNYPTVQSLTNVIHSFFWCIEMFLEDKLADKKIGTDSWITFKKSTD
jgi:SAM-dependent methyltransferase